MASERAEPKMLGKEVHAIAETVFNEANINDLFIHGLGHGVGKEVHEQPYLDKKSEDILETGTIITIEPGIYIQGWGGIRIEDMFEVTDTGLRQLTTASK
jgi:Xaa-Pro aminopeptidase